MGLRGMPVTYGFGIPVAYHRLGMLALTILVTHNNRAEIRLARTWPRDPTVNRIEYVALHESLELLFLYKMQAVVEDMAKVGFNDGRWATAKHDTLHSLMAWMRPDLMVDVEA